MKLKLWLIASAVIVVLTSPVYCNEDSDRADEEAAMTLELSPEIIESDAESADSSDQTMSSMSSNNEKSNDDALNGASSMIQSQIKLPEQAGQQQKQLSSSATSYFESYLKELQEGYGRRNQKAEIVEPENLSQLPGIAQSYKYRDFNAPDQGFYQPERRPLYSAEEQMIPSPSNADPTYEETRTDISQYSSPSRDLDENGFTPIGMSVEDAFKKYFPASKQQEAEDSVDEQPQQQDSESQFQGSRFQFSSYQPQEQQRVHHHQSQYQQQHQQQDQQQHQPQHQPQASSTQYFESVQPQAEHHQQQQPMGAASGAVSSTKDMYNIDHLRSIVETSPLAKPNPFDPPSPPLSAFLPPPAVQPGATLIPGTVHQYGASSTHQEAYPESLHQSPASSSSAHTPQAPMAQPLIQQQPPVPVADYTRLQPATAVEQDFPISGNNRIPEGSAQVIQYQQMGQDVNFERTHSMPAMPPPMQPQQSFMHFPQPMEDMSPPSPPQQQQQQSVPENSQPETADAEGDEDEGAPYQTVPLDESGKRLPLGYSKPVDFAELEKANSDNDQRQQFEAQPLQQNESPMNVPQSQPQSQNHIVYGSSMSDSSQYEENEANIQNPPTNIEYGGFVPIKKSPQSESFNPISQGNVAQAPYEMSPPQQSLYEPSVNMNNNNNGPRFQAPQQMSMPQEMPIREPMPQHRPQQHQSFNKRPHHQSGQANQKLQFRPYFGKDAIRKLNEMGISEEDFYKTVQKVMKSNYVKNLMNSNGMTGKPMHSQKSFMMPKANFYRRPNKGGRGGHGQGMSKPMKSFNDDIQFNYFKDDLPPGASYNPRDVGLDESVLAQIHMLDSGIGGYRYPVGSPASFGAMAPFRSKRPGFGAGPKKSPMQFSALQSVPLPAFFYPMGKKPMRPHGAGYRLPHGYGPGAFGAASEIKPQFQAVPKPGKVGAFKFLAGSTGSESSKAAQMQNIQSAEDSANALSNLFGMKPIKGIKSLVSYFTGSNSPTQQGRRRR